MFTWAFSIINMTMSALEKKKLETEQVPSPVGQTQSAPSKLLIGLVKVSLNANM